MLQVTVWMWQGEEFWSEITLDCPCGPSVITKVLIKETKKMSQRSGCDNRSRGKTWVGKGEREDGWSIGETERNLKTLCCWLWGWKNALNRGMSAACSQAVQGKEIGSPEAAQPCWPLLFGILTSRSLR